MIYLDSAVLLAQLLGEERRPPVSLWSKDLVSSRLSQYEVWTRLHALGLGASRRAHATALLRALLHTEMTTEILERALAPFPVPLRTLDALHLASVYSLRTHGSDVSLMTFDRRMSDAARAIGIPLWEEEP